MLQGVSLHSPPFFNEVHHLKDSISCPILSILLLILSFHNREGIHNVNDFVSVDSIVVGEGVEFELELKMVACNLLILMNRLST